MSELILRCPRCYVSGNNVEEYDKTNYSQCNRCKANFNKRDEKHDLLHLLWTRATHLPGYEKKIWQRLQQLIEW
jgi:hypothetical protein